MDKEKRTSQETGQGRIGYRPFSIFILSIIIRAIHQIGAAVFLATYLLDYIRTPPIFFIFLAAISGVALFFAEWMRHRQIYRELSGISTLTKLILLGLAYHNLLPQTGTVITAFIIASLASHAPRNYRHRLLF